MPDSDEIKTSSWVGVLGISWKVRGSVRVIDMRDKASEHSLWSFGHVMMVKREELDELQPGTCGEDRDMANAG